MRSSFRSIIKTMSRIFYTGGTVLLLVGMLLSMISQPVKAAPDGPVGRGGIKIPTQDPNSDSAPAVVLPPVREAVAATASARKENQQQQQPVVNAPAAVSPDQLNLPPDAPAAIAFTDRDSALCLLDPTDISVTVDYHLPTGQSARLQVTYYIVHPGPTPIQYIDAGVVSGDGSFTYSGLWPGVQPSDPVVEIHFGAALLNVNNGNTIVTTGLDYYWYPWVCPPPTPTLTPTATATATATFTPTATFTFTPTPTDTATFTPTVTNTDVPTATFTFTPTATDTEVPTATFTFTPTVTDTVAPSATFTFTPTVTNTLPTPPPNDPTQTFTPTVTATTPAEVTPSFTPSVTSTLPVPPPDNPTITPSGGGVLIPVTGADLSGGSSLANMLINIGLVFLSLGLILSGLNKAAASR